MLQCPPERVVARPQDDAEHPVLPRPQRASFDMTAFCRARTCPCIEVTPSGPGGNLLQSDASVASKSGRLRLPVARLVDNRRIGLASGCCLRLLPPLISHRPDYAEGVARSLLQHIHNPLNRECGCDPDCWCRRTAFGRVVKWWFPARLIGLHHKNEAMASWKADRDQRR